MIFNKYLSIFFAGCLFLLMMFLTSSVIAILTKGGSISYFGLIFVVIYYFIAKSFYNYLRNDGYYKNTKTRSSDMKGEKYIVKGERDNKKLFVVIWVLIILVLASISLVLFSYNHGLV